MPLENLSETGAAYGYDFRGSLLGDKAVSVVFDNSKLKKLAPQMTTTVPFHKGVRIALEYVLAHPEKYEEDPEFDAYCDNVIASLNEAQKKVIEQK